MFKIDRKVVKPRAKKQIRKKEAHIEGVTNGSGTASIKQVFQYCGVCDDETRQKIGKIPNATRCFDCSSVLIHRE